MLMRTTNFFLVCLCIGLGSPGYVGAAGEEDENGKIVPFGPRKGCKNRLGFSSQGEYAAEGTIFEFSSENQDTPRINYREHRPLMIKRLGPPLEINDFHAYGKYMIVRRSDKWGLFHTSPAELDYFLEAAQLGQEAEEESPLEILQILLHAEMKIPRVMAQEIAAGLMAAIEHDPSIKLRPHSVVKEIIEQHSLRLIIMDEGGREL